MFFWSSIKDEVNMLGLRPSLTEEKGPPRMTRQVPRRQVSPTSPIWFHIIEKVQENV